jgi:hypothetical protein
MGVERRPGEAETYRRAGIGTHIRCLETLGRFVRLRPARSAGDPNSTEVEFQSYGKAKRGNMVIYLPELSKERKFPWMN